MDSPVLRRDPSGFAKCVLHNALKSYSLSAVLSAKHKKADHCAMPAIDSDVKLPLLIMTQLHKQY